MVKFAEKLIRLVRDFDPYDFDDNFENLDEAEKMAVYWLRIGETAWIQRILENIIENSEQPEEIEEAEELLKEVRKLAA